VTVLVGALGIAVGLFASGDVRAAAPDASGTVADASRGQALYLQSCAACHGPSGQGGTGPAIANAGPALVDFVLRTGRMPLANPTAAMQRGTPVFGDADIAAIVAYVSSLGSGPGIPSVQVQNGRIASGQELYTANCAACHGAGGAGGTVGTDVAPALDQADPRTVGEAVVSGPGPMPRFLFSQQQLDDLAAYVQGLKTLPHPGGLQITEIGPVAEGFLAGSVGIVTLLAVARWIASSKDDDADDGEPGQAAAGGGGPA
jgi:ubiquinol-cytochrome c reductase cytochrome c subunit